MKTFKDFLSEMPIAKDGDWKQGMASVRPISYHGYLKDYENIGHIDNYEVLKHKNDLHFVIGYLDIAERKTKSGLETYKLFRVIMELTASRMKSLGNILGYKRLIKVNGVAVSSEGLQKRGYATFLYKKIVNELHYTIMGDREQYFGARRLWARISSDPDVIVDIVNVLEKKIVAKNVKIHHGMENDDFDTSIWSNDSQKEHIRPIVKKVI